MHLKLQEIKQYLLELQNSICNELEKIDGKAKFQSDVWQRTEGGGGDDAAVVVAVRASFRCRRGTADCFGLSKICHLKQAFIILIKIK